jgi:glycosyltransferase involved in cell wall biosynthesis
VRILVIYQYFGTHHGSWSTRVYEMSKRWVEAGHNVVVVTAPYEKSDIRAKKFIENQSVNGIELCVINVADSNRYVLIKRVFYAFLFAFFSAGYALTLRYDVIICSSGPITVGIPGILARFFRRKKFVFEVRDLWPAGGIEMKKIKSRWQIYLALWFEKLCYKQAQHVVAASPGQEAHIKQRFPFLKTQVVSNACDLDLFESTQSLNRPAWAMGKIIFSHIGSLGYIHNAGLLIEAALELARFGNEDILLVLIGDGVERESLEQKVRNNNLKNVIFLGLLPKDELPPWIQASVATLFTTLDNPVQNTCSPNKIFDSLAGGTPVIQTTTGWIRDLFENEKCGMNVPPENPKALAEAMLRVASDDELRVELSANALRVAQTLFDRSKLANEYLNLLISLHER